MQPIATPLVSIVIPVYNRASLVVEALNSVRSQTYRSWEAVVVDDRSTDHTEAILNKFVSRDGRIRYLKPDHLGVNGAPAARNRGIAAAVGKYIVFLDSDDVLAPTCLEQRVKVMEEDPSLDFAVFPQLIFRNRPGDSNTLVNILTGEDDLDRFLKIHKVIDVPWITGAPIWKRRSLMQVGLSWNHATLMYQDVEFHVSAIAKGLKYKKVLSSPDCYWRWHSEPRIGNRKFDLEISSSTAQMLVRVASVLNSYARLTDERKTQIIRLLLSMCVWSSLKRGEYRHVGTLLKRMWRCKLLSNRLAIELYLFVICYAALGVSDTFRFRWERRFMRRWGRLVTIDGVGHFCKTDQREILQHLSAGSAL